MRIRFHFRIVPFVAVVVLVLLGIALARWQTHRGAEKQHIALQLAARAAAPEWQIGSEPIAPDAIEYRRVKVHGHFVREWPLYLDNRPQDGRPGFYVVMPFQIAGSASHVLVERGWIPLNPTKRSTMYPYRTASGEIDVVGIARRNAGHVMQLGSAAAVKPGALLQNLEIDAVARASGLQLQPFVIEQSNTTENANEGMLRDWPKPSSGIERHQGYAFQWYALAVMAFLFFVVTGIRRESK